MLATATFWRSVAFDCSAGSQAKTASTHPLFSYVTWYLSPHTVCHMVPVCHMVRCVSHGTCPPLPCPTCLLRTLSHLTHSHSPLRSPAHSDVFLSASGDTSVRLWDLRQAQPTLVLRAHAHEVLTADWCKYTDCILATGSIDKTIRLWDARNPMSPLTTLFGHS